MAKLIRVSNSTYRRLADQGRWYETMDGIIVRLMLEANLRQQSAAGHHHNEEVEKH
jgi:hypothetical protein